MKNRPFGQRCLGSAGTTLKDLHATSPIEKVFPGLALRAFKPLRPARFFKNGLALGLGTIVGQELIQAHPGLELDSIHLHGTPPWEQCHEATCRSCQNMSYPRFGGRLVLIRLFIPWWQKSHPDQNNTDPVIRAGVAHYWFVAIHPFADGNGRIARALSNMALAQSDGAAKRCYSLSSTIMENRDGYYSVLESTSNGQGDITKWLAWFLDCLELSLQRSKASIEKVLSLTHSWHNISDISLNDRQIKVVKKLLEAGEEGFAGVLTAKKYHGMVKGSRATLTRDLADLVDKGILLLTGEQNAARYHLTGC